MIRNRVRYDERCRRMKEKNDVPNKQALDNEQAFRRGYADAVEGRIANRDQSPFSQPTVRKYWKQGFDMGKKGLVVALPRI